MIREISIKEVKSLEDYLYRDVARNYFILLGIESKKEIYDRIFVEEEEKGLVGVLFRRKSGTLQFYGEDFDLDGFGEIIRSLDYKGMIGPRSYWDKFANMDLYDEENPGAYIGKLSKDKKVLVTNEAGIRSLRPEDLDQVEKIYKEIFSGFTPKEEMEEKLNNKRGRGVCLEVGGDIVSLAQTDFDNDLSSVIVGVATKEDYRGQGLATRCMEYLIRDLQAEGKDIYLQYDNLSAGRIYERLGFEVIDRVFHYKKIL